MFIVGGGIEDDVRAELLNELDKIAIEILTALKLRHVGRKAVGNEVSTGAESGDAFGQASFLRMREAEETIDALVLIS